MKSTVEVPIATAAALIMACIAINDILDAMELTEDILDELRAIQPHLNAFLDGA